MYTKEKKNRSLLNLILGIIAIIIIIFIIIWIINKGRSNTNLDKVFENNLQKMQDNAIDYFSDNLPEINGEVYKINLDEMIDLGISDTLYYGKTKCDNEKSYISATKTGDNTYQIKSNLVCSNKQDNLVKRITIKYENSDEEYYNENKIIINNNTINNQNTNTNSNVTTNTNTNTNKNNTNSNNSCKSCSVNCSIEQEETECTTVYEYQYVKKTYGCPDGYSITSDGKCSKSVTKEVTPTKVYSEEKNIVTDAKKTNDSYVKIYTAPIIHAGTSTTKCSEGELINGQCISVINATAKTTVSYSCPSGYTPSTDRTKCTKPSTETINATVHSNTSYTCPSGYSLSGDKCYVQSTTTTSPKATTTTSYTCPSGYTQSSDKTKCTKQVTDYKTPNANTSTSYTCPSGYTQNGSICKGYKTETASSVKQYTNWGNPVSSFDSEKNNLAYEKELEKLVMLLPARNRNGVLIYSYEYYQRSLYYVCPSSYSAPGSITSTTKCSRTVTDTINGTPKTTTTYTCPTGYSPSGNVTATTKCSKTSTETINATVKSNTTYACPTGYSPSGNVTATTKCYKSSTSTIDATPKTTYSYSCPSGYTQSSDKTKCTKSTTITINATTGSATSYYCSNPAYSLNGNKCYKYTNPNTTTTETTYTCPSEYTSEGTGSNTKCYKYITNKGNYYCENAEAKLDGNKCILKQESKFLYNTCPTSYSLNESSNKCVYTTKDVINMISTGTTYIYSSSSYLEGYTKTGRTRYYQKCHVVK